MPTTAIATEVARRRVGRPRKAEQPFRDMRGSLAWALAAVAEGTRQAQSQELIRWPSKRYQEDPVGFAREVLGVEPWSKQVEILEAIRDHARVTVRSGHKCGKSMTAAIAALWFYCSYPDARVVMSSVTARQVDAILWREVRKLRKGARVAIDGEIHELARSGLKAEDFREIVGFTAKEAEAVAGVSGSRLLYLLDEASGIDDAIFEAIEGNRAGGARVALFSNPTKTDGEFYRSHCDEKTKRFYKAVHVSSEDTPNALEGREVIPALASLEWIEEKREEWGIDSPLYKVRVRGEFVLGEDGKILTVHAIAQAEARWADAPAVGRLFVGLDPAGEGDGGDESVWAARRGAKVLQLVAGRALTPDAHIVHTLGFLNDLRQERDQIPVLLVDREGEIGARVYAALRGHLELHPHDFELVGVRASERCASGAPVDRIRDGLWANLRDWLRDGGAIPEDAKLAKELHAPSWIPRLGGRDKVTPKTELRKLLGRSPDRADAVALSVWEPAIVRADGPDADLPARPAAHAEVDDDAAPDHVFDPYRGGMA